MINLVDIFVDFLIWRFFNQKWRFFKIFTFNSVHEKVKYPCNHDTNVSLPFKARQILMYCCKHQPFSTLLLLSLQGKGKFHLIHSFVRTLVIIVNIKLHRRTVWQRIPCNQCEYKATTQSSLMTHIESVHEKLKYPCNEVSHIIRKITFIMILPAFRDREYCLNVS